MKKIIGVIIVGLFFLMSAKAQPPVNRQTGTGNTLIDQRVWDRLNLYIPHYDDTTVANFTTNLGIDTAGAIIYTYDVKGMWIRQNSPKKWIQISGAGSSATSITNIYNNSIVNIFIYNDSCVILQTGAGTNVDTICTQFDCGITGWTITSDSTMQICGHICPDTTTIVCDNFNFPPQHFYIFNNGLTQVIPGYVEWGGTLNHVTGIDANYNYVNFYGRTIQDYPYQFKQYQSATNSSGIASFANIANTTVRYGMNWMDSVWRNSPFVPGPNYPYRGLWFGGNGTYSIGQPSGYLLAEDIRRPTNGIYFHEDTSGVAGDLYGIKWATSGSGAGSTTNSITNSKALSWYTDKRVITIGRFEQSAGANVTAANNLTLGADGNLFTITGNTQINAITTSNWQSGSVVRLLFTGTPTVKNNTAGGAGTAVILLSGGTDFAAAANDVLTLTYNGTAWNEAVRKTASGIGSTNSNVGSAYRWAIPNTNNIKTFSVTNGLTPDSATSNQIGIKLGGSLSGPTTVEVNGNQFNISSSSSNRFIVNSTYTWTGSVGGVAVGYFPSSGALLLGDINENGNKSKLTIDDASQNLEFSSVLGSGLRADMDNQIYELGDISGGNHGTTLVVNDADYTVAVNKRFLQSKGDNVTSAGDLILSTNGNVFHITAANTINAITTLRWNAGSVVILIFDSNPTVKNNTSGGVNTAKMLLAGGADFSATANDVLTLVYDGSVWLEVSRSIN